MHSTGKLTVVGILPRHILLGNPGGLTAQQAVAGLDLSYLHADQMRKH